MKKLKIKYAEKNFKITKLSQVHKITELIDKEISKY